MYVYGGDFNGIRSATYLFTDEDLSELRKDVIVSLPELDKRLDFYVWTEDASAV